VPIGDIVLAIRDVSFSYGQSDVLRNVEIEVRAGEVVVLGGRNGAGKSTLLRCAAGWSRPTEGHVELLGQPIQTADRELRREVALVTDTPPFYDDLTAREHVRFLLRANRLEKRENEAERLLDVFALRSAEAAYPSALSRGMRYKLGLVLALMLQPKLLLLDEPFGPIDAASARALWTELRSLAGAGSGVLLSAHQTPEDVVPDRYLGLSEGRVVEGDE
jgi:ABC-2 type transport system ATP-binding protein